jgi:signal transduction histidine kinase
MQLKRIEPNKSLALTQVNKLLGRVFSIAATLVGSQTVSNALIENSTYPLVQFWFWLALGALIAAHLVVIFTVWVIGDGRLGFALLTLATAFALATWHLQLGDFRFEPGVQPWIWWSVGIAGVSAIGGFNFFGAVFFIVALPTAWFLIQISEYGVAAEPLVALQDASFAFLFVAVLAGFVYALRYESAKVDEANQKSNQAAIDLARADAVHRERDRIDALVHDSVLTTLLVSSNAEDSEAEKEAELLARAAIEKLISAHLVGSSDQTISVSSLFGALEVAIRRQSMKVNIDAEGASDELVPSEVAAAVTESTLQALANAIHHAGTLANIEVLLRGNKKGIKIVVKDNGRGFRPARIPRNRLGLKLSIVGRMQSVGGRVFIDSKIGIGTNIVIEWSAN